MPTLPIEIHAPVELASFHLLFLSEGFQAADQAEFIEHCRQLKTALLKIDPFRNSERRFAVSAVFTASQQRGVGQAAGNTAFRFTLSAQGELRTRQPGRIVTQVADITPVSLGGTPPLVTPLPVTGANIWMSDGTRGYRAVCVIVREAGRAVTVATDYQAADLDDPAEDTDELKALVPFIAMSMWPSLPASQPVYSNPATATAAVLARELGAIAGLGYESELTDAAHETFDLTLDDPDVPNLATDRFLRQAGQINRNRIPWRGSITPTRLGRPVEERDHPAVNVAGETPMQEVARYDPIRELMNTNVVLLRHPRDPANPGNTSGLTTVRYKSLGKMRLVRDEPHLIEGGGGFRRGIYRPSVECLMRFEGSDTTPAGVLERKVEAFCVVCHKHVDARLQNGAGTFRFGGVRVARAPATCPGYRLPSRLAQRLVQFILSPDDPDVAGLLCVVATVRRYETFFRTVLQWRDVTIFRPQGWYQAEIEFPTAAGVGRNMWKIWMSHLAAEPPNNIPGLREDPRLHPYAGLGAPGAIWFAGLGCLANVMRPRRGVTTAGRRVRYALADNLTDDQLRLLEPGSLLQLWRNRPLYVSIVEYVRRITDNPPNLDEGSGHSLFYMGTDANNRILIADQYTNQQNPPRVLADAWPNLTFRIAAQWHDAINVPEPEP